MTKPKPMPSAPEAERGALGSILYDGGEKAWDLAIERGLSLSSFVDDQNNAMFKVMQDLKAANLPIDVIAIANHIHEQGLTEKLPITYIQKLIDDTPTSRHITYYIAMVLRKELLRRIILTARKAERNAFDEASGVDPEVIRATAEAELAGISSINANGTKKKTLVQLTDSVIKRWKDNATGIKPVGIMTGIRWIDDAIAGIMDQSYIIISGQPKSCKSTLCRMIADSTAMQNIRVAIKTTEKTAEQYLGDSIAAAAQLSVHQLNLPNFDLSKLHFLDGAAELVKKWPMSIDGSMGTKSQIVSWANKEIVDGAKLLIYDYLQDTLPETTTEANSDESRMSNASLALRAKAKESGTPIIAVSSESNAGNLRHTGQIKYDLTAWIHMRRADDYDSHSNPKYFATIKESRYSPPGTEVALFYFYGRLLTETEYCAKLASFSGHGKPMPTKTPTDTSWIDDEDEDELG